MKKVLLVLRIRDVALPLEACELLFSAFSDGLGEIRIGVACEIAKRRGFAIFLPHKNERCKGREDDSSRNKFQFFERKGPAQPVARQPVSYLVMTLGKGDELIGGSVLRTVSVSAPAEPGILPGLY